MVKIKDLLRRSSVTATIGRSLYRTGRRVRNRVLRPYPDELRDVHLPDRELHPFAEKAWLSYKYLMWRIESGLRWFVAGRLPGYFPTWFSTLDRPGERAVQRTAYQLARDKYVRPANKVLDVGFGLGYGLEIMVGKAAELRGIEIDERAVTHGQMLVRENPKILELRDYDGKTIPYPSNAFDVVSCVDVIEHVPDYTGLINEMVRVSRRVVVLSTPNQRPENTRPDGRPKNRWHLREWSYEEFDAILQQIPDVEVDWNFLNGPKWGPFEASSHVRDDTRALTPALTLRSRSR